MKDSKLIVTSLRGMAGVAISQNIETVSLPAKLIEDIADQMETLISIIEDNELETDRFKDYLLETKEKVKLERAKPINTRGGDPRGG
ncbi:hypothetical protein C1N73_34370 (plasmid) [Priestia aryabhattai]